MVITCTKVVVSIFSGFHASLVDWSGVARDEISLKPKPPEVVLQGNYSLVKG